MGLDLEEQVSRAGLQLAIIIEAGGREAVRQTVVYGGAIGIVRVFGNADKDQSSNH